MTSPPVVLVGLDNITGLQASRLLAARGIDVVGLAANPRHFACRTRTCRRVVTTPLEGEDLVATLVRLGPEFPDRPVLIPCTDGAVQTIAGAQQDIAPWFRFVLPPAEVVDTLIDKSRFGEFAQNHDLPVPRTELLTDRNAAERAAGRLSFPVVIKPAMKSLHWKSQTTSKAFVVDTPEALLARYDESAAWADVLVAQELIPGPADNHFTCNLYFDRASEVRAAIVTRKLRQWPPGTGTGSLGEECTNDDVLKLSLELFGSVPYAGLAYVEVKRDLRDGTYRIIEPNIGRPTGRSATAEAAGLDLLYAAYADAAGLGIPDHLSISRPGVKWIYLRQDLQSALSAVRRRNLSLAQWIRSLRGARTFAVFSWRDPLPFVFDVWQALRKGARALTAR